MPNPIDLESVKKYMLVDTSPLSVVLFQEVKYMNAFAVLSFAMIDFIIGRTIQCTSFGDGYCLE